MPGSFAIPFLPLLLALPWLAGGCPSGTVSDDDSADDDDTGDDDTGDDDTGDDDSAGDDDTGDDDVLGCSGGDGAVGGGQFIEAMGASAWLYVPEDPLPCAPLLMFGHGGSSPGGALDGEWDDKFHTNLPVWAELRHFPFVVPYLEEGPNIDHTWATVEIHELDAMIDEAGALVDIDLAHVLFAGTSAGGHMAAYYGLYAPDRLSHVAVLSAGIGSYFEYPDTEPDPRLPFFVGHDPDDSIVPYSYSEDLADDLALHDHVYLFEDLTCSGDNHHGWTPVITERIVTWWLDGV